MDRGGLYVYPLITRVLSDIDTRATDRIVAGVLDGALHLHVPPDVCDDLWLCDEGDGGPPVLAGDGGHHAGQARQQQQHPVSTGGGGVWSVLGQAFKPNHSDRFRLPASQVALTPLIRSDKQFRWQEQMDELFGNTGYLLLRLLLLTAS